MNRFDLELVVAVVKHGSLSRAARELAIAAPLATKRLAALETKLGMRLFQRTTRRVSATAEGEMVCTRAKVLLQGFLDLESELQDKQAQPSGLIRLASTFGFGRLWLGPTLARFQVQYPRLEIQLTLTEQLPDLAVEGFDGAIWLWAATGGRAARWVSRRLAVNQRVLVASPDYLKRHGTPDSIEALQNHACLIVHENGGEKGGAGSLAFDVWPLQKRHGKAPTRVKVHGSLASNSGELVRDWCLAGHGIALRSLWDVSPQLASGDLVQILPAYTMPDADIHWLAPHRPDAPKRIRLLIDFLVDSYATEPWKHAPPAAARSAIRPSLPSPAARRGSRPAP